MPAATLSRTATALAQDLIDAIDAWWDQQAMDRSNDPFAAGTLYDVLIDVDSHTAVTVLLTLEPIAGVHLPEAIIKPGGYSDRQQMVDDLIPKIEQLRTESKTYP